MSFRDWCREWVRFTWLLASAACVILFGLAVYCVLPVYDWWRRA